MKIEKVKKMTDLEQKKKQKSLQIFGKIRDIKMDNYKYSGQHY